MNQPLIHNLLLELEQSQLFTGDISMTNKGTGETLTWSAGSPSNPPQSPASPSSFALTPTLVTLRVCMWLLAFSWKCSLAKTKTNSFSPPLVLTLHIGSPDHCSRCWVFSLSCRTCFPLRVSFFFARSVAHSRRKRTCQHWMNWGDVSRVITILCGRFLKKRKKRHSPAQKMRKATGGVPAEGQSVLMDPRGFQIKSDGSVNQDSPGVPSLVLCLSLCLSLCLRRGPPPMSRPTISGFVTHGKLWFWSRKLHIIRDIHCQVASYEKNAELKDLQCDTNV